MKPSTRLALLLSLVLGSVFALSGPARADHQLGHDHPFCAQGGGQGGPSSGGPGGTIHDNADLVLDNNQGGEVADTFVIPEHLGPRFGEDDPRGIDDDGDGFIEVDADLVEDEGTGSNGSAFHGGHGGGHGGGQGGSTFFGAGDGGCSPVSFEAAQRRPVPFQPGRRLPVTGTSAEQFALMGGVFLILGGTFVFAPQIINAINGFLAALFRRPRKAAPAAPVAATEPPAPHQAAVGPHEPQRETSDPESDDELWARPSAPDKGAVSRLRDEISSSWGGSEHP